MDGDRQRGGLEDDLDVLLGRGRLQGEANDDLRIAVLAGLLISAEERRQWVSCDVARQGARGAGCYTGSDSGPGNALVLLAVGTALHLARVLGSQVSLVLLRHLLLAGFRASAHATHATHARHHRGDVHAALATLAALAKRGHQLLHHGRISAIHGCAADRARGEDGARARRSPR